MFNSSLVVFSSPALSPNIHQCISQILKALIVIVVSNVINFKPQIRSINLSVIETILFTLKSPNQEAQYESYELMKDLIKRAELHEFVMKYLLTVIKMVVEVDTEDSRKKKDVNLSQESQFSQQAYASKLLGYDFSLFLLIA